MAEVRLHQAFVRIPSGERLNSRRAAPELANSVFVRERHLLPAEQDLVTEPIELAPALDHVDLVVHHGETVVIIGPSGCGKTTLLRAIAGLQMLEKGEVWFDDRDMTRTQPGERGIGMVFQNYALYPHMRARGNLGFFFHVHHREKEIDDKVREVAQVLGLGFDDLLDRRPRELSGGEKQRVAIGRCIIRNPSVFLFDEPLSNLDAKLRQTTRVEIKRLLRRYGISAVYVTHDQTEAMALADRIAVMRNGRIEQIGPYRQVHDDPASLYVATFLGIPPCNVLPGQAHHGAVQIGETVLESVPAARVHPGSVVVGIRPEHVTASLEPLPGALHGTVERIEQLPSLRTRWVTARIASRDIVANAARDEEIARGDTVYLSIAPDRLFLFDASDGRRLRL